ncbi:MAG TPA: HAD hydrolase-like protein [Streptosporangiaceae bacterium]
MSDVGGARLACFGLIGTTVADDGILERAYAEAIATQGVVTGTTAYARGMAQVHRSRGKAVIDVLRELFPENEARAQAACLAFDKSLSGAVQRFGIHPVPGAPEALDELAGAGWRSCVISSVSRRQLHGMLDALGWHDRFDLAVSADEVPRGCPWPDLVLHGMLNLGVDDVRDTVVVQATESGVLAGRRAGAGLVAGVLTGAHPAARLRSAGATQVLGTVAGVPAMVAGGLAAALMVPRPADAPAVPSPIEGAPMRRADSAEVARQSGPA